MAKGEKPTTIRVAWLVGQFLDYVEQHRAPATYVWYENYLTAFAEHVGDKMRVGNLTPAIVNRWIGKKYPDGSQSCHHAAARCVVRMLNWAVAEKIIDKTPLPGFVKPAPNRRETAITAEQYAVCLEHAKGRLKDAFEFLWETGCRPFELRHLQARYVNGSKAVFPLSESKGHKKRRVVYLNETAAAIVKRLSVEFPDGPIFRNSKGKPWKKDALNNAFARLRDGAKIVDLCPYSLRHAWITRMLERGVDVATVAALAGNSARMVLEQYNHVANNSDRLASMSTKPSSI
jgi:integrase